MPQLDQTDTYLSQIFWLITSFGLLYLMMRYLLIPRLRNILDARANQIASDLERASTARQDAVEVFAAYERIMSEARHKSETQVREAFEKHALMVKNESDKLQAELDEKFSAVEARVNQARDEALADLERSVQPLVDEVLDKSSDGLVRSSKTRVMAEIRDHVQKAQ
ncbi:MAG: hypothetical protein K0U39_02825 [Alphaproteobacteria bacterium]|nr:hypothetical protein [Alphaproteobacteria bacterium]